ncbi:MAG: metal-sulfur cluster assembly factor, partial [Chrysiogenetes bacterium]|nr:metal-sulfur cluster assembly factor [Chrysiogenetes bacterium]
MSPSTPMQARVFDLLSTVIDPELGINIVDLGLVLDVQCNDGEVSVTIGMTSLTCPVGPQMRDEIAYRLETQPWVRRAHVSLDRDFRWTPDRLSESARAALGAPKPAETQPHQTTGSATGHAELAKGRLPFLLFGALSLLAGLLGGLLRIGWSIEVVPAGWVTLHGPLMVCGFLGVVITLERAVGLEKAWGYAAPALAGAGVAAMLIPPLHGFAPILLAGAALAMITIYVSVLFRGRSLPTFIELLGALCWLVGIGVWLSGAPVYQAVPWWALFLVLTIAGERLELNSFLTPTPFRRASFLFLTTVSLAGAALGAIEGPLGARVLGVAFVGLSLWLLAFDVARTRLSGDALARFIAVCLLSGYAWLAVSGSLLLAHGMQAAGLLYDATWHALFVGFVFGMIFAHAPIVFPAVLRVPVPM